MKYFIALFMIFVAYLYAVRTELHSSVTEESALDGVCDTTDTVSILFCGDLMLHMPQVISARYDGKYVFDSVFTLVKPIFEAADIVVTNLETTISEGEFSGYPRFRSPSEIVWAMKNAGIDVAMLANNHCCDAGRVGIETTAKYLDSAKIVHMGVYADSTTYARNRVKLVEKNGVKIAFLNYTYGTNGIHVPDGCVVNLIDTSIIKSDLFLARAIGADVVIPFFHWGEEYMHRPSKAQTELVRWCMALGVNNIIGSHPHVVQPIETITCERGEKIGTVAYSLGNFISNQRMQPRDGGVFFKLTITKHGDNEVKYASDYQLFWVDKYFADGRYKYVVIPDNYGRDTMPDGARKFLTTTQKILNDGVQQR